MRERLIKEIQRVDKKTKTVETMSEKSFFKWLAKALKKQSAGIKLK
jgi:hypothetical protein